MDGSAAPKRLLWPSEKQVPDVFMYQCFAVSCRLRELIEKFEPDTHQFFAVQVVKRDPEKPCDEFFWLNVCTRLDSVDDNETTLTRKVDYNGRPYWTRLEGGSAVFSTAKIGPHHLWYDPNLPPPFGYYCSDAFADAAQEAGFLWLGLGKRAQV